MVAGCGAPAEDQLPLVSPQEADSAFALVTGMDESAFRAAFEGVFARPFERTIRTEEVDRTGSVTAYVERRLRHEPSGEGVRTHVLTADSAGRFDFGFLRGFVSGPPTYEPVDVAEHVLEEDPAYASPRSRDAYHYRFLPDTTLAGARVRVVEVTARPEAQDVQHIRRIRFYVAPAGRTLVGLAAHFGREAMFFDEETTVWASVRPAGGGWVPDVLRSDTRLDVPLRPPQRFRSETLYATTDARS